MMMTEENKTNIFKAECRRFNRYCEILIRISERKKQLESSLLPKSPSLSPGGGSHISREMMYHNIFIEADLLAKDMNSVKKRINWIKGCINNIQDKSIVPMLIYAKISFGKIDAYDKFIRISTKKLKEHINDEINMAITTKLIAEYNEFDEERVTLKGLKKGYVI